MNKLPTFIGPVGRIYTGEEIWLTYEEGYSNAFSPLVRKADIKHDYHIYFQESGAYLTPINGMYVYVMT